MRTISLDCETFLIGPSAIAPKMVCFTTAMRLHDGTIYRELVGNGDPNVVDRLRELFEGAAKGHVRLVFHNGAYDMTVIATSYPELEPLIWGALEEGNITDTMLREQLLNLSTHGQLTSIFLPDGSMQPLKYNLSVLTLKWLGIDTSHLKEGDDIWRLNYHTLDGLKASQYPRDAVDYALGDAQYTLQVYEAQEKSKELEGSTETEFFQTAASFALRWITIAGMATDPEKFEEMQLMLARELSEEKLRPLVDHGLMRAREPARPYASSAKKAIELLALWTGEVTFTSAEIEKWRPELEGAGIRFREEAPSGIVKEALQRRVMAAVLSGAFGDSIDNYLAMELEQMVAVAKGAEIPFKRTDKGGISTDSEVIDDLSGMDKVLECYRHRQKLQKMVSTEIPRMMWEGKLAPRVHWPYKTLLETGRTSSSADSLFPSGNGQQIHPMVRPIFKGLLISTDYSTLELVCVAQVTLDKFGYSVHAEKINAGYDLHAYLGAQLALRLSPFFRKLADKSGIDTADADEVYALFKSLASSEDEDEKKFYKHWRKFAKPIGLGFPGGLGPYKILTLAKKTYGVDIVEEASRMFDEHPEQFDRSMGSVTYWAKKLYGWGKENTDWTPTLKGIALAAMLRNVWFETYPEMREYLKDYLGKKNRRFDPDSESDADTSFEYRSPFGMLRAGCSYTAAANGEAMQTPAAEGFKTAVFNLVKECRIGSLKGRAQVVNEIHDETITEVLSGPEDLHDVAMTVKSIMESSMQVVIRDVKVKAEPAAMERWDKAAEPVYVDGKLVPWRPKEKKAS